MIIRAWIFAFIFMVFGVNVDAKENITVLTSIPKCGTHLLLKVLQIMSKKPPFWLHPKVESLEKNIKHGKTHIIVNHFPCSDDMERIITENNASCFFIYRDPRDQVVSYAHWILREHAKWYPNVSVHELMRRLIDGSQPPPHVTYVSGPEGLYHTFMGWKECSHVCAIRFEDLIGPLGGGTKEAQLLALQKIALHLDLALSIENLEAIAKQVFGDTNTFRSGKIGSWKKEFTPSDISLFKKHAGNLLIELGYESDFNW